MNEIIIVTWIFMVFLFLRNIYLENEKDKQEEKEKDQLHEILLIKERFNEIKKDFDQKCMAYEKVIAEYKTILSKYEIGINNEQKKND